MAAPEHARRAVARNRKALHDYFIDERFEAGIQLAGTEVKALREGRANIGDAYAAESSGELWLFNAYIPEYNAANRFNHETRRPRRLLMKKRELGKLFGRTREAGITLVPLAVYFNPRGWAKVELGLARGKRQYDKRAAIKDRDWKREKERMFKTHDA
jgi:SsrA-binding protein